MQQGPEADKRREERRLNKEQKLERAKKREAKGGRGEKKERKQKKIKKTKLAGQPKRPMSSYFLWMNANREKIKKDLGAGAGLGEIAKKAGELWKELSDKSVSTYSHLFNKREVTLIDYGRFQPPRLLISWIFSTLHSSFIAVMY